MTQKEIIKIGEEKFEKIQHGDNVKIKIKINEENDGIYMNFLFGKNEINKHLEEEIEKMKINEISKFKFDKNIFSFINNKIKTNQEIQIQLIEIKNKITQNEWKFTKEEVIKKAINIKEDGNILLKENSFQKAIKKYKIAIKLIKSEEIEDGGFNQVLSLESNKILLSCYSNISVCQLKLKKFDQVIKYCDLSLKIEKNTKSLFRKAQALAEKYLYDDAIHLLDQLLLDKIDDKQKIEIENEIKKLKIKNQNYSKEMSKIYKNILNNE
jgi:tetratricopeptide (TPR) repeat protein